jgi:hypothetical protein
MQAIKLLGFTGITTDLEGASNYNKKAGKMPWPQLV